MSAAPLDYITDVWNMLDLTSTICACTGPLLYNYKDFLVQKFADATNEEKVSEDIDTYRALVQIFAAMFLWIKFLYFFRTRDRFGYLIRMIEVVLEETVPFMCAFFVLIIAFSDAFYSQSKL